MRIRRAEAAHCETLSMIAHAAKAHWGYPERWLELWAEALTLTPRYVAENEVHAAFLKEAEKAESSPALP